MSAIAITGIHFVPTMYGLPGPHTQNNQILISIPDGAYISMAATASQVNDSTPTQIVRP